MESARMPFQRVMPWILVYLGMAADVGQYASCTDALKSGMKPDWVWFVVHVLSGLFCSFVFLYPKFPGPEINPVFFFSDRKTTEYALQKPKVAFSFNFDFEYSHTPVISDEDFCSTWGNYHYRTFDGDFYHFPSTCNYVLARHCAEGYKDFSVHIQRVEVDGQPTIQKATLRLDGMLVELSDGLVRIDNKVWVVKVYIFFVFSFCFYLATL